jgi:hypothetical protein
VSCDFIAFLTDGIVRAQSWLKGRVVLDIRERMQIGDGLSIELIGKETSDIPPSILDGCLTWPWQTLNEHIVFHEYRVIHEFGKTFLGPGMYVYVFSFYLPGNLPPSMNYEEPDRCMGCSVNYVLKARVGEYFKAERDLQVVGATLTRKAYPHMLQPTCFPLSSWWLIDYGYLVLGARMENSHVGKGTTLDVSLTSRNKSRVDIERVEVQVVEHIEWKTNKAHQPNQRRCIAVVDEPNVVLPGLVEEMEDSIYHLGGHEQASVDGLMYAQMHGDLTAKRNLLRLPIPSSVRDSYSGKLVKVSHYLKVTPVTKGGPNNPVVKIPIKIFDLPIESIIHTPIKPKPAEVTTSWPDQVVPSHAERTIRSDATTSATPIINESEE